jgi:hypothetical protein
MPARAALATRNTEFYDERVFDADAIRAMRPSLQPMAWPWLAVHQLARERGIALTTADRVTDERGMHLIAYDWTPDAERLLGLGARPSTLVSFEPPVIAWWLFAHLSRLSARFSHTFWFEGARQRARGRFHRLLFPIPCPPPSRSTVPWAGRRFLVMVNSNKVLAYPWNVRRWFERPREVSVKRALTMLRAPAIARDRYRARIGAIDAFADAADFDLYGEGWQQRHPGLSPRLHARAMLAYRGTTDDKLGLLGQYRFALAMENTRFKGYVSEKLFDCLFAGTIPVYDGAPDVADYVPCEAFVDCREFSDLRELERRLRAMTEPEARRYLDAGQEFLASPGFERFSVGAFARDVVEALND